MIAAALLLALQAAPQVRIDAGVVRGKRSSDVDAFLGIPYAADAGGANRWRAPLPVPAWTGIRAATDFGANCEQGPPYNPPGGTPWTPDYLPTGPMSEDCLSLNVWTPDLAPARRRPVLVWIHGGGFGGGSSSVPIYDGTALARQGIVVVTINYRVGVFGFLALPQLTAEAGSSGNYGIMDQIAALAWVRRNIARFGGDPAQVTVAGQSAGATSVHVLMAAPRAKGLFIRAIAESGLATKGLVQDRNEAEMLGDKVAAAAGVADLAALRALPVAAIRRAADTPGIALPGLRYVPVREPAILPDPEAERGDVPVLIGLNADEASVSPEWRLSSRNALADLRIKRFGASEPAFRACYDASDGPVATTKARALLREQAVAAMLLWADRPSRLAPPVYAYVFDHPASGAEPYKFGSFHTAEVPYVFGTLGKSSRPPTPTDRRIGDVVSRYWVNFIRSGDPNGGGLPRWPAISTGKLMRLGDLTAARAALPPATLQAYRSFVRRGGKLSLF